MVTKTTDGKFRASYLVGGIFVEAGVFDTPIEAETEADRRRLAVLEKYINNMPILFYRDVMQIYVASLKNFKNRLDNMPTSYSGDTSKEEIEKFKRLLDVYCYRLGL